MLAWRAVGFDCSDVVSAGYSQSRDGCGTTVVLRARLVRELTRWLHVTPSEHTAKQKDGKKDGRIEEENDRERERCVCKALRDLQETHANKREP